MARVRYGGWRPLLMGLVAAGLGTASDASPVRLPSERTAQRSERCARDPRVLLGLVSKLSCVGAELFFRETFAGNGRTCGTCHPASNNYTLDAEFIERLSPADPLFVAERVPALAGLEIPALLRQFGLNLVNADGFDDLEHKFVVRSVSHTLSLAISLAAPPPAPDDPRFALDDTRLPPLQRTGWAGDGAPGQGELRDFADGAIAQHAPKSLARIPGVDFALPTDTERDVLVSFMMGLGRQSEAVLSEMRLSDAGAEQGRRSFLEGAARDCGICHSNAGANASFTDDAGVPIHANFSTDIGTEFSRLPAVDTAGVPFDGGFGTRPLDIDGDGVATNGFGNGAFNAPPLIEAVDTGPLFHTHASPNIEDAIRFYTTSTFGDSLAARAVTELRPNGGPFQLTEGEIAEVGRFLRVLNAAFNGQIAAQRLTAVHRIEERFGTRFEHLRRGLLELTRVEIDDAIRVLAEVPRLNRGVQGCLRQARAAIGRALRTRRSAPAREALRHLQQAQLELGTGLAFELGPSTLLF